jgi:ABC-type multidrug transport system fused ATPase/permease subunit
MFSRLSPLFPYLRRYWKSFVWGGLALIIYNLSKAWSRCSSAAPPATSSTTSQRATVEHHALRLLAVAVVSAIFLYLTRQIIIGASREIEFDLRNDLFAHLETQPPEFFQRHRTGDIMARSTNDLNAVRQLLGPAIMYSANTIVFTAAAAALHAAHQPAAHPLRLLAIALRVGARAVLRSPHPHAALSASRPCSPTSPRRPRRTSPAHVSSAPSRRKKRRSPPSKTPTASTSAAAAPRAPHGHALAHAGVRPRRLADDHPARRRP